jgi:hypothetical protein
MGVPGLQPAVAKTVATEDIEPVIAGLERALALCSRGQRGQHPNDRSDEDA